MLAQYVISDEHFVVMVLMLGHQITISNREAQYKPMRLYWRNFLGICY